MPVLVLTMVTLAPGSTAPEASTTVPRIVVDVVWALATGLVAAPKITNTRRIKGRENRRWSCAGQRLGMVRPPVLESMGDGWSGRDVLPKPGDCQIGLDD